jgi:hypothetical protein
MLQGGHRSKGKRNPASYARTRMDKSVGSIREPHIRDFGRNSAAKNTRDPFILKWKNNGLGWFNEITERTPKQRIKNHDGDNHETNRTRTDEYRRPMVAAR